MEWHMGSSSRIHAELIDVGGYSLYARLIGSGSPTVVFICGLGEDMDSWNSVQPDVGKLTSTLAYDRAGLGESEASPHRPTISNMVHDLHFLLAGAKLPPPYLLVAHSLGGFVARMFADHYPEAVCGLVLVDAAHERYRERLQRVRREEEWAQMEAQQKARMEGAPEAIRAEFEELEHDWLELKSVKWMTHIPLTILTATRVDAGARRNGVTPADMLAWKQLHAGWIKKVPGARHIVTGKSGHYIQLEEPELVIEAIREMLEGVGCEL